MRILLASFLLFLSASAIAEESRIQEERLAFLTMPSLKGFDPCYRLHHQAEENWSDAIENQSEIQNHCKMAKYNCTLAKLSFDNILEPYKKMSKRCERENNNIKMREVKNLPKFKPIGNGYYCCFGFDMPKIKEEESK